MGVDHVRHDVAPAPARPEHSSSAEANQGREVYGWYLAGIKPARESEAVVLGDGPQHLQGPLALELADLGGELALAFDAQHDR